MAKGDHLYVQRANGLYAHHGIDCGDGTAIHYSGEHWYSSRSVRHTTIEAFARGDEVLVRDYAEFFARLRDTKSLPRRLHVQLAEILRGIDLPVLILAGMRDGVISPESALRAAVNVRRAKAVLFEDEGHMIGEESPERLAREVKLFVDELEGTALPARSAR
ncbi:MAG: lecithin retinol acyltransferase family protein [Salinibacterium sp.]|nr:lecithin retinol acyltransferase family protein [Salinibacterium sp.]